MLRTDPSLRPALLLLLLVSACSGDSTAPRSSPLEEIIGPVDNGQEFAVCLGIEHPSTETAIVPVVTFGSPGWAREPSSSDMFTIVDVEADVSGGSILGVDVWSTDVTGPIPLAGWVYTSSNERERLRSEFNANPVPSDVHLTSDTFYAVLAEVRIDESAEVFRFAGEVMTYKDSSGDVFELPLNPLWRTWIGPHPKPDTLADCGEEWQNFNT